MGYKKPTNVTRKELINFPLPHHGGKYKTVSHKFVIDQTLDKLKTSGFIVTNQIYRANKNGSVAEGKLYIKPKFINDYFIKNEEDLGMMFAWVNSYDKSIRFSCGIGAYVSVCSNGMVGGELGYSRKHIGTADYDILKQINKQIDKGLKTYRSLIDDKDEFINITLSLREQSSILGRLFIEEELLDPGQLSIVKKEMSNPTYDYGVDQESLWSFYNHITHAMKKTHPKKWMLNHKKLHDFFTMQFSSNTSKSIKDTGSINIMMNDTDIEDYEELEINESI